MGTSLSKKHNPWSSHMTTILFLIGFVFDILILPNIDDPNAKIMGLGYILVIALLIVIREWVVARNTASKLEQKTYTALTFLIVCLLGSTLSFVSIYAFRSAELSVSWPFFAFLLSCILANELISTHMLRLALDVGVLFIATVFYAIFHIPVLLKESNDTTFGLSIILAIATSVLYAFFLTKTSETAEYEAPRIYALALGVPLFVGMLYYSNVIPAVPLSLKQAGVYHSVQRNADGTFTATYEEQETLIPFFKTQTFTLDPSDPAVYFFSAVDAPSLLTAPLSHVWEYYDSESRTWKESFVIPFGIQGGRDSGYRAYSVKDFATEGLWRVTVKVDENRIVGRLKFKVQKGNLGTLKTITL